MRKGEGPAREGIMLSAAISLYKNGENDVVWFHTCPTDQCSLAGGAVIGSTSTGMKKPCPLTVRGIEMELYGIWGTKK